MRKETKMYLTVEERTDWINVEGCGDVRFYPHPELDGIYVSREGLVARTGLANEKIYVIEQAKQKNGYVKVSFNIKDENENTKFINKLVHRLVLETFASAPDEDQDWVVDHMNSDRSFNDIKNLQWLSRTANLKKRDENGSLFKPVFIYDRVTDICTEYVSRQEAAKAINVQTSNLSTAIKYESVIKGRYYPSDVELFADELYYIFKEYDLKRSRRSINIELEEVSKKAKQSRIKFNKLGA